MTDIAAIQAGRERAHELAARYGLDIGDVLAAYRMFKVKAEEAGYEPSLRAFEIEIRTELAKSAPEVRNVEPLYCKGLDPLNPYNKARIPEGFLAALIVATVALVLVLAFR